MTTKTNNSKGLWLCSVFLVAYAVMPVVSLYVPSVLRMIFLLIALALLSKDGGSKALFSNIKLLIPIYIFYIIDILFSLGTNSLDAINKTYDFAGIFIVSLLFLHAKNTNPDTLKPLLKVMLFTYGVTILTTIIGNSIYPQASRRIATGMTEEIEFYDVFRSMNIGGFAIVYAIVLPCAILPYIVKSKTAFLRLGSAVFFIAIMYCSYITQYTTALIVVLATILFFFTSKDIYRKQIPQYTVIFLIVIALIRGVLPPILQLLSGFLDDPLISERLSDMASMLTGNEQNVGLDTEQRQEVYKMSVDAFLSSPLIGTGTNGGGHSMILDAMARYGLIGVVLLFVMLKNVFGLYIKPYKETPFYGYLVFAFLIYLFLIVLNPSPLYLGITFILPLLAQSLQNTKNI